MCGVFGVIGCEQDQASELTYLALYALQHRGQESAGMAVSDGERIRLRKGMGLASQVFGHVASGLPGGLAIGHVRYAASRSLQPADAQPLTALTRHGPFALAFNGDLTHSAALRRRLLDAGSVFQTTTDGEVILNLIASMSGFSLEEALLRCLERLEGAFAVVALCRDRLIGFRDPHGIRPLSLGRLGDAWALASETCAFSAIGAEPVRDIEPGEMVVIDRDGVRSQRFSPMKRQALCVFEYIYFARPDSEIDGRNVHLVRKEIGRMLAREHPVEADVVIPTPDSAISAAMGYAEESGIPYEIGLIKNRYVGRTFIQPTQTSRQLGVRIKLNPVRKVLEGKRVVLLDDSIVRGNTTAKAIQMMREAGAAEVHMVVASPPFAHPCHYGIDVPSPDELIASRRSVEEVRGLIGADSLHYLSFEALHRAIGRDGGTLCSACFSGAYPTKIPAERLQSDHLKERV